jgi:hypothetical protein
VTILNSAADTVARLVDILGAPLVAVIANVKQTRTVREWIEGREPLGNRTQILQCALEVANAIKSEYDESVAQSWFQGLNHRLLDEAPALVLNSAVDAEPQAALEHEKRVLDAVLNFLER